MRTLLITIIALATGASALQARPVRTLAWTEGRLLELNPQAHTLKLQPNRGAPCLLSYNKQTMQWDHYPAAVRDRGVPLNVSALHPGDLVLVAAVRSGHSATARRVIVKSHAASSQP